MLFLVWQKYVKVEGIFASYSTVLILSISVVIWNMLPDNPACQPITYVTSRNLATGQSNQESNFRLDFAKSPSPTLSSATTDETLCSISSFSEGVNEHKAVVDSQDSNPTLTLTSANTAEALPFNKQHSYCANLELLAKYHSAETATSILTASPLKPPLVHIPSSETSPLPSDSLSFSLEDKRLYRSTRNRYTLTCEALRLLNSGTSYPGQQPNIMPVNVPDGSRISNSSANIDDHVSSSMFKEAPSDRPSSPSSDLLPRFHHSRRTSTSYSDSYGKSKISNSSTFKSFLP